MDSLFLCFITLSLALGIESDFTGFSTNLIHRTSPLSSRYNSSNTLSPPSLQAPVTAGDGDYSMKVSLGTPPVDFELIADTGSDLVWTQCKPCISCYKQDDPLFDPKKSSTYKKQSCNSFACKELPDDETSCDKATDTCQYQAEYGDGSHSSGNLSSESFTFQSTSPGSPVVMPNIVFGCGDNNGGSFDKNIDGVVGLGNGKYSLVNQLSRKYFSYCLVPLRAKVTSTINFGAKGVVSGPGVKTTPFYKQNPDTYYYLNLEGVSINGKKFKLNNGAVHKGNTIIDSGTPVTYLPKDIWNKVQQEFEKSISAKLIKVPGTLQLCYKKEDLNLKEVPTIIFHFEGADIDLDAGYLMTDFGDVTCLPIAPPDDSDPDTMFGNWLQINFLIGYDLEKKTVSFKKVDCSKQY